MNTQEIPPPSLQRVLTKIETVTGVPVRKGAFGQNTVICPAHEDNTPSLSISYKHGKVVLHCHAGCETAAVLKALGLKWADLEDPEVVTATYVYNDEDCNPLHRVKRTSHKNFPQSHWDAKRRRWVSGVTGIPKVPYHLERIAEALATGEDVMVCAGEKDVDVAWAAEHVIATTNSGGEGKWGAAESEYFRGSNSRVTIVADRDHAGYVGAIKTYDSLLEVAGIRAEFRLSAVGNDLTDHVEAGLGLDSLVPVTLDEMIALKNAPEDGTYTDERDEIDEAMEAAFLELSAPRRDYIDLLLSDEEILARPPLSYVVDQFVPRAMTTALFGQPGSGKTFVGGDISGHVRAGIPWLCGFLGCFYHRWDAQ